MYIDRAFSIDDKRDSLSTKRSLSTASSRSQDLSETIGEMAPLYFFLASSLNTELVYIILKSVSSFTWILADKNSEQKTDETQQKLAKINIVQDCSNKDVQIRLKKIKIKQSDKWSLQKKMQDERSSSIGSIMKIKNTVLELDSDILVKFYSFDLFTETFK